MKKTKEVQVELEATLSEHLNEHPVLTWIADNKRNLFYIVIIIACAFILTYRVLSYWQSQAGYNYVNAENTYIELNRKEGEGKKALIDDLLATIQKQPDLEAKYDGLLAQILLVDGDLAQAEPLINRSLKRVASEASPLYIEYAKNSLVIGKQDFTVALQQAEELQQKLLAGSVESDTILFPMNLLRIAFLQQKLGKREDEKATWLTWKAYSSGEAGNKIVSPAYFQEVASLFQAGKVDLKSYIETKF